MVSEYASFLIWSIKRFYYVIILTTSSQEFFVYKRSFDDEKKFKLIDKTKKYKENVD